jgi:hypothetical protein
MVSHVGAGKWLHFDNQPAKVEEHPMEKKTKRPVRKPWTKDDIRELKGHAKARTPIAKISKAMKRTPNAVRQKAYLSNIILATGS